MAGADAVELSELQLSRYCTHIAYPFVAIVTERKVLEGVSLCILHGDDRGLTL